jgi:hypothetical protein
MLGFVARTNPISLERKTNVSIESRREAVGAVNAHLPYFGPNGSGGS